MHNAEGFKILNPYNIHDVIFNLYNVIAGIILNRLVLLRWP
jgi:hypothetical protein